MNHTIEKLKEPFTFMENNGKPTSLNGYAFIDEHGRCIIITYGEGRRDQMSKYLSGPTDELHIKYQCVNMLP